MGKFDLTTAIEFQRNPVNNDVGSSKQNTLHSTLRPAPRSGGPRRFNSRIMQPSQIAISGARLALPSEGKGHTFESCRVRHFGAKLGTSKPAAFALEAATSVRRSTLFEHANFLRVYFDVLSQRAEVISARATGALADILMIDFDAGSRCATDRFAIPSRSWSSAASATISIR
jgi:hypothetical protein